LLSASAKLHLHTATDTRVLNESAIGASLPIDRRGARSVAYCARAGRRSASRGSAYALRPRRNLFEPIRKSGVDPLPLAVRLQIEIKIDDRFRERVRSSEKIEDVVAYLHRSFADGSYRVVGGESLNQAAVRGLAALADIRVVDHHCAVVASHRTLISSVLRSINSSCGLADWQEMRTPDVFVLQFEKIGAVKFERV
jgi:hypothetical protein